MNLQTEGQPEEIGGLENQSLMERGESIADAIAGFLSREGSFTLDGVFSVQFELWMLGLVVIGFLLSAYYLLRRAHPRLLGLAFIAQLPLHAYYWWDAGGILEAQPEGSIDRWGIFFLLSVSFLVFQRGMALISPPSLSHKDAHKESSGIWRIGLFLSEATLLAVPALAAFFVDTGKVSVDQSIVWFAGAVFVAAAIVLQFISALKRRPEEGAANDGSVEE